MPTQWPTGRYETVMLDWRLTAMRAGLTEQQTAILAAQFAGLAAVRVPVSGQGHAELLDVCTRSMLTAAFGADAMAAGAAIVRRALATETG